MTLRDPAARPTAHEALLKWQKIRQRVILLHQACRLRPREENLIAVLTLDIFTVLYVAYILAKRFAGWSLGWVSLLFR